jgi:hypothetical protein
MGLSNAIGWWDEWKLRILVLGSLFVHTFLCFSIYVRKSYALRRLRVLVWIAYIGSDEASGGPTRAPAPLPAMATQSPP